MTETSHSVAIPLPAPRAEIPNRMPRDTANGKIEVGNRTRIFIRDEKKAGRPSISRVARLAIRLYLPASAVPSRYRLPAAASWMNGGTGAENEKSNGSAAGAPAAF